MLDPLHDPARIEREKHMTQIAATKLHIGDDYYVPGDPVPANEDVHEDLAELLASGAIVTGEPATDGPSGQRAQLVAHVRLEKYDTVDGVSADDRLADPTVAPDAVHESVDNLLLIGGASALLERLIGTSITAFDSSNSYLAVGDSTTAAADTQTDLQAATNKTRKAATVSHTDSTSSSGAKTITVVSTFATTDANHRWREWGWANASTAGRMLNRKVEDLDGGSAKTSAQAWQLTITFALA